MIGLALSGCQELIHLLDDEASQDAATNIAAGEAGEDEGEGEGEGAEGEGEAAEGEGEAAEDDGEAAEDDGGAAEDDGGGAEDEGGGAEDEVVELDVTCPRDLAPDEPDDVVLARVPVDASRPPFGPIDPAVVPIVDDYLACEDQCEDELNEVVIGGGNRSVLPLLITLLRGPTRDQREAYCEVLVLDHATISQAAAPPLGLQPRGTEQEPFIERRLDNFVENYRTRSMVAILSLASRPTSIDQTVIEPIRDAALAAEDQDGLGTAREGSMFERYLTEIVLGGSGRPTDPANLGGLVSP